MWEGAFSCSLLYGLINSWFSVQSMLMKAILGEATDRENNEYVRTQFGAKISWEGNNIFDTPGSASDKDLRTAMYSGTDLYVICFSMAEPLDCVKKWVQEIADKTQTALPIKPLARSISRAGEAATELFRAGASVEAKEIERIAEVLGQALHAYREAEEKMKKAGTADAEGASAEDAEGATAEDAAEDLEGECCRGVDDDADFVGCPSMQREQNALAATSCKRSRWEGPLFKHAIKVAKKASESLCRLGHQTKSDAEIDCDDTKIVSDESITEDGEERLTRKLVTRHNTTQRLLNECCTQC